MYVFQMGSIFILNLANDTIAHPLENIDTINSKGHQISSNICIENTPKFFLKHPWQL
jgi:hypothetical protein